MCQYIVRPFTTVDLLGQRASVLKNAQQNAQEGALFATPINVGWEHVFLPLENTI